MEDDESEEKYWSGSTDMDMIIWANRRALMGSITDSCIFVIHTYIRFFSCREALVDAGDGHVFLYISHVSANEKNDVPIAPVLLAIMCHISEGYPRRACNTTNGDWKI